MNRQAGHTAPFLNLLVRGLARKPRLQAVWRVKSFERSPAWTAIVAAHLGSRNRAAVQFPVIDGQRVDLSAVLTDAADLLPILSTKVPSDLRFRPGSGAELGLINRHRMSLERRKCIQRTGQTGISPFVAVEGKHAGPSRVQFPIVTAHRVWKKPALS